MEEPSKPKVYFTKKISPKQVVHMFQILKKDLPGNVAIKVHSGEEGNTNYLKPEMLKPIVEYLKGTIVECNTAYPGARNYTDKHVKLMKDHGWSENFKVDILDAEGPDITLKIPHGNLIKENYVGKNMKKYNSCLVVSHFKGHAFGGFGGALKQLSIGFGSTAGKTYQHTAGKSVKQEELFDYICGDLEFKETMADAAWSVVDYFKGNMAFINLMVNMSIDCDCDGHAKPPCMKDIGILSSLDPVALDKACLDLVYFSDDKGKRALIKRIEDKLGPKIIDYSVKLGTGKRDYELIEVV